ncbi:MAG TPA: thermonuclease family protein [Thermosynechococcaceae cyanobacterium]
MLLVLIALPVPKAEARARCSDFASQEDAQAYMQQQGATYLDGDKDGIACERLPRRSSTAASPLTLPQSIPTQAPAVTVTVVSVGDGDTLRVASQEQWITVRLACVDAPEMSQSPYGQAAAQRLKQLLPVGQSVTLQVVERDRYGRTVAQVYRDNLSINLQMVQEGQAVVYRQYLRGCPGLQTQLLQAENQARQQRLAFWSQANPVMPEVFRRSRQ